MHNWLKSYGNVNWEACKGVVFLIRVKLARGGFVTNGDTLFSFTSTVDPSPSVPLPQL